MTDTQYKDAAVGVILAGGGSRRMGGRDKARLLLGSSRLIDHAVAKMSPQVSRLIISGQDDYDLELPLVRDRGDGPLGPAAGLWAAAHWVSHQAPNAQFIVTAPVDGPFAPPDLVTKLGCDECSTIAVSPSGPHPTFACWHIEELLRALADFGNGTGVALQELSKRLNAREIAFPSDKPFFNINSPADFSSAREDFLG